MNRGSLLEVVVEVHVYSTVGSKIFYLIIVVNKHWRVYPVSVAQLVLINNYNESTTEYIIGAWY